MTTRHATEPNRAATGTGDGLAIINFAQARLAVDEYRHIIRGIMSATDTRQLSAMLLLYKNSIRTALEIACKELEDQIAKFDTPAPSSATGNEATFAEPDFLTAKWFDKYDVDQPQPAQPATTGQGATKPVRLTDGQRKVLRFLKQHGGSKSVSTGNKTGYAAFGPIVHRGSAKSLQTMGLVEINQSGWVRITPAGEAAPTTR